MILFVDIVKQCNKILKKPILYHIGLIGSLKQTELFFMKTSKIFSQFHAKHSILGMVFLAIGLLSCNDDDGGGTEGPSDDDRIFVSSGSQSFVYFLDEANLASDELQEFSVPNTTTDSDGIFYDEDSETIYVVNRSLNQVDAYDNANDIEDGEDLVPMSSEADHFNNGRGIAYANGNLIVADDIDAVTDLNEFVVFSANGNTVDYSKTLVSSVNLWGIQLIGGDLWAVSDNTANIVAFNDIISAEDGELLIPDMTISIEGMVRTHGIFYDEEEDVMVLTDVGDGGSDSDGAFFYINEFSTKINDDMISEDESIKVSGGNTMLGNPVDIKIDPIEDMIYIAERLNGSGRLLVFETPEEDGNFAPAEDWDVPAANSVFINED